MDIQLWYLAGAIATLVGAFRQMMFQSKCWGDKLGSTLSAAAKILDEDAQATAARVVTRKGLIGWAYRARIYRRARKQLEKSPEMLLTGEEAELLRLSNSEGTSWALVLTGAVFFVVATLIHIVSLIP